MPELRRVLVPLLVGAVLMAGPPPLRFRVDRPFAFTISDTETGTILFLGTVTDPRG